MTEQEKREKVIRGLECCTKDECECCPYENVCFGDDEVELFDTLARDALALLKAQEPVKPTLDIRHGKSMWRCGSCSTALQPNNMNAKFCFNCGQAVKWK